MAYHWTIFLFRDMKPQNLLLFEDGGVVKISDMGLARTLDLSMTCDRGTQLYICPGNWKW